MAKAHQQYYADEVYIQKQAREFSPTEELLNLAGGEENVIEEIRVNGVQLIPDQDKAVDITVPSVVDALDSTSTADALSAKQGKVLYDYIQNISARGRFLSNWNCATGLATTNPEESPYAYRAGDYFIVSNIAAVGGTNYRPSGASYVIGQASTDVETASVGVSDLYIYDGTNWILMSNGGGSSIAVDSSLSTTSTNPVENRVITNELNKKYYGVVSNSAPSNPTLGMIWYDTTSGNFKTYDGSGWVRKLDLGLNKVFDNSTVEIGKWAEEGGVQSSGHHVTIDPNGEVSTYNVTVAGHNEATLGSGTLELLSNTALGGDETLTISHEQIVANDGTNTQIYSFFGNDRIAKLSDIGGGYSAGAGINITNNVISADTTVLATKSDLDEKQDGLTAGDNVTIENICATESDMKGPAPSGFHVPLQTEWVDLSGVLTTTFSLANNGVTWGTYLKMPMAGMRSYQYNTNVGSVGNAGRYWFSNAYGNASNTNSGNLMFSASSSDARNPGFRAYGYSVRCLKNTPVIPDSSWTTLYDGSAVATNAGIFWSATEGLISISGDGTTWYTIMDKNLGATTVYNYGDVESDANCGYFYQWGNNYGFPHSGSVTASHTQIDSTGYGPGNYYSSSTYIGYDGSQGSDNWSSVNNRNLWGGDTQSTRQDCKLTISATDTTYTAGAGINITNNVISADTSVLATQTDLNSKANATDVNLKSFGTFPGSGLSDLQALYDWLAAGNYAEVTYDHMIWIFGPTNVTTGEVESYYLDETPVDLPETGRITGKRTHIEFTVSDGTVTGAYGSSSDTTSQVWGVRVSFVAPTIGQATNCFWYDTNTHKLKAWNGTSWDIVGDDSADINTKTFYLSGNLQSAESIAAAQAAYDWYLAGKNPLIYYSLKSYSLETVSSSNMFFYANSIGNDYVKENWIMFDITGSTVDSISAGDYRIDSANTKTFTISSTSDLTNAQAAYDWYDAGKNPIVKYGNNFLTCAGVWQDTIPATKYYLAFTSTRVGQLKDHSNPPLWAQAPNINNRELLLEFSNDTVTAITEDYTAPSFLPTNSGVEILYSPSYDWDPATKKYVDDRTTNVKVFSPTSPMSNADALAIAEYTNNTGTAIIRYNGDEYFPAGTEDRSQPGVVYIDGTPTGYIYKTHPSDSSNVIKIIDITATIGLNSSSLDNISYSSMGVMLNNTTGTSSIISDQWVGTEAEYNLLSSYGANTIYFII